MFHMFTNNINTDFGTAYNVLIPSYIIQVI